MKKKYDSVYLAIHSDIRAINKRFKLERQLEISLLNAVYGAHLARTNLRVLDLLLLDDLASQATIHATLKTLATKALIEMRPDPSDGRSKFVFPTKLALKRLKECEASIHSRCK